MRNIEIFDHAHFEKNYYRVGPPKPLSHLIDFFWQTKFDDLWQTFPRGFSDALFPNIGYTYLINLGTPFIMQVGDKKFKMKSDGFLPRHKPIECHHQQGNIIFGIKFKISPIIFEKKINFSEYKESIFPLSYLLDKTVIRNVKQAKSFKQRVELLSSHYMSIVTRFDNSIKPLHIVSGIIDSCITNHNYNISIKELAKEHNISTRTLQRYFENSTSLSSKKTLQILRVRKAVEHLANDPGSFDYKKYGYYDYSHFYKHLRKFLQKTILRKILAKMNLNQA